MNIEKIIEEIQNASFIALDTETISLEDLTLIAFSFAYMKNGEIQSHFVPCRMNTMENISKKNRARLLSTLLSFPGLIFHNYSFDAKVFHQEGFDLMHCPHDTLIISHLLNEHGKHGLKFLAQKFFDYEMRDLAGLLFEYSIFQRDNYTCQYCSKVEVPLYIDFIDKDGKVLPSNLITACKECVLKDSAFSIKELKQKIKENTKTSKKHKISFADLSPVDAEKYAKEDAHYTLLLFYRLMKDLKGDLKELYDTIERPLLEVVTDMHKSGVTIDYDKVREIENKCLDKSAFYLDKLKYYMEDINLNSTKQLKEYFIDEKGLPVFRRSKKTNALSMDSEALEKYAELCKEAEWILEYRKYNKILTTFIPALTPIVVQCYAETFTCRGKIFPTFNQSGTTSGRFSASKPNPQQFPQESKEDANYLGIRECIVAEEGYKLIGADYCVALDTLILKKNLSWEKAINIKIGDELIGFDEYRPVNKAKQRTKFKCSKVINKKIIQKPCYKITTNKGSVISSNNHFWMTLRRNKNGGGRIRHWIRTDELTLQDQIAFFVSPWEDRTNNSELQYLARFFDGEGWIAKEGTVGWGQKDGVVLQHVNKLINKYGYEWNGHVGKTGIHKNYFIYQSKFKFLGEVRPKRLMQKTNLLWDGKATWNRYTKAGKILKIEYIGNQDVVFLETSTHTFIANGFLSHNSQMELRLAGHFSQDKNLCSAYQKKKDIHQMTADATGASRYDSKTINFSVIYGITPPTLAKNLKISVDKTIEYMNKFWAQYSDMEKYLKEIKKRAVEEGKVKTLFGRYRRLKPSFQDLKEYQQAAELRSMTNAIIQGSGADIIKYAMVLMHPRLKKIGARIILQVHDELLIECPRDKIEEGKKIIKECMLAPCKSLIVPMEVEIKVGQNWGEVH